MLAYAVACELLPADKSTTMEQPPAPNPVLTEMFRERRAVDASGSTREIRDEISREHAIVLFNTVLKHRPRLVVEVGMAFGASSLAILSALSVLGDERALDLDRFMSEFRLWQGWACQRAAAGFSGSHELHEAPSYLALPRCSSAAVRQTSFTSMDGTRSITRG